MAWRTWKLHWGILISLALVQVGMIAALAALHHISYQNQGFTSIKQNVAIDFNAGGHDLESTLNIGFLWTSLPSLLMILFAHAWGSVVDGLAEEMPMRDLTNQDGAPMKKTILLDYRRYISFFRFWPAFKNRHLFLSICLLFTVINTIILAPLASRLFALATVDFDKPGVFLISTAYNVSASFSSVDYAPIFATVTAVQLHGGTWPAFTDGTYAYPTFVVPATANLTRSSLEITGYTARLDCVQVGKYSISRIDDSSGSTISISANDRGCDIAFKGGVGSGSTTFLKTQDTVCNESSGQSRYSFFAGTYDPSAPYLLDDLSVISCIPSYAQTQGKLSVPSSLQPLSFNPKGQSTDARIDYWLDYEDAVLSLSNIGDGKSQDFTSAFGELILGLARRDNPSAPLSPDTLINSTTTAFTSIFAVFAEEYLFDPTTTSSTVSGTLTVSDTRLTAVTWSIYTSIAILSVLLVLTVSMFFYLNAHQPILPEEPRGIASATSLLYGSTRFHALLDQAAQTPGYQGKFYEWLKHTYPLGRERCTFNRADGIISIHGLPAAISQEMVQQQYQYQHQHQHQHQHDDQNQYQHQHQHQHDDQNQYQHQYQHQHDDQNQNQYQHQQYYQHEEERPSIAFRGVSDLSNPREGCFSGTLEQGEFRHRHRSGL